MVSVNHFRMIVVLASTMVTISSLESLSAQSTWHVDASVASSGSGSAQNPFKTIQVAINAATDGDTVLVAPGTYVESLIIVKAIDIVSTSGPSATTLDASQTSSTVTFHSIPMPGGLLQGFTVTGGQGPDGPGGFMYPQPPPLISCNVVYPLGFDGTPGAAGGINCAFASPTIRDCIVTGNTGGNGGNGSRCGTGSGFGAQAATGAGGAGGAGGVYLFESAARIEHCLILGNIGGDAGQGSSAIDTHPGPGGVGGAGGIQSQSTGPTPLIVGCIIANNQAGDGGLTPGGQYCNVTSPPKPGGRGGTGGCDLGIGSMVCSTIAGNLGGAGGQGSACFAAPPAPTPGAGGVFGGTITNCVVWSNAPSDIDASCVAAYSNSGALAAGPGNVSQDPQFVDEVYGDYHLLPSSPCVDAGDNAAIGLPMLDIDGDPRVFHGTVDMGADETVLSLLASQGSGPGSPVTLTNFNLTPGNEYFNVFSLDLCPSGAGSGPYFGLCVTSVSNYQFVLGQVTAPLGTPVLHFIATPGPMVWGPYPLPPMTIDAICFQFTGGTLGPLSSVSRITVQ